MASRPRRPAGAVRAGLLAEAITRNGGAWIDLVGSSMEPTLPLGARLRVVPCPAPRPGDVVLLRQDPDDVLVTHRVLACLPGGLLVHAGDAWPSRGQLVASARVLGRVLTPRVLPPPLTRLAAVATAALRLAARATAALCVSGSRARSSA